MINFVKNKNIYLVFSATLVLLSIFSIVFFGFNFGIELAGGSVLEIEYQEERPPVSEVREKLSEINAEFQIQELGESGFLIRTTQTDEDLYAEIMSALEGVEERYFESIGPTIGDEIKNNTLIAMIVASFMIVIYIATVFSGKVGPISSWQYGLVATVVAFFHDVLILVGIFTLLGYFWDVQFTIPIIVALLTTLGYSLNDTVVLFDRIRENGNRVNQKFRDIVNTSINQTITRSINTSITTLLVLLAILFLGGETLFYFILALVLGIILGTYSSIFLASYLILFWKERFDKVK